jgi:hypothetical protein
MDKKEILLYPALVRWKHEEKMFRANVCYPLRLNLTWDDIPNDIEDTIFWWSDDTPYEGMDMDEAVLVSFDGQPTLVEVD